MDTTVVLDALGYGIYTAMALSALYGVFCVILLIRRIKQKRFASSTAANDFLNEVRGLLDRGDFTAVAELCDSPRYWAKAVPQLILLALEHRKRPIAKLRQLLAEQFEREILADLEYRTSWVATIVKAAPMLGLLGTVTGMISAFGKIAAMQQQGSDPSQLAGDISFALLTTALGLTIAIPLVIAGAAIHVRIGKLQDQVQEHISLFLDDLEAAVAKHPA
ncbi:MAG: MotA/TolQ/ExbB proton channel family protein [Planctomycetota bacterium]|nr:MAG: MotA/TolQ/ExbB proton channel family protein [Planctomycetota bacterium]